MDQRKIIGENIKTARKLKGLSQRALAEKLGIAFQNLSVWENGKGAPSARYLMKLAEILEISIDQLTSERGVTDAVSYAQEQRLSSFRPPYQSESMRTQLQADISGSLLAGLAESHSMKLIVAYLEEIINLLRQTPQQPRPLRHVADSKLYSTAVQDRQQVPLPPSGLSAEARNRWERNAAALLRWSQSDVSFWVPRWVLEKFCQEVEESKSVSDPGVTSDIIKGLLDQGQH
ncbi:MAG: helix-turn-helix transcriptional regulator [Candidatus Glassbacteria bacterium]|nr:helix-turn-helix transcriptional regulator [Candidatus Glassbacteria bacterium]